MCRLRLLTFFPRVVSGAGPGSFLRSPDRLGVDDRRRRRGLAPGQQPYLLAQLPVHLFITAFVVIMCPLARTDDHAEAALTHHDTPGKPQNP
jgi:hypothetical protein